MRILKEAKMVETKKYFVDFDYIPDPTSGYSFDADSNFKPVFDNETQRRNFEACEAAPDLYERVYRTRLHHYREPAVGKCVCGREVVLEDQYKGACMCGCGRWYNIFEQSLIDPEYWQD